MLASLRPETVYVGLSAGSMAVTPSLGETYNDRNTSGYRALSLVDFSLAPHLDHPDMPDNSMAEYEKWAAGLDFAVPTFDDFWAMGRLRLPTENGLTLLADFRADPKIHRLKTPSGRIEIFSEDIDGFGYDDCGGHPKWFEPSEWLRGSRAAHYPLHLLANPDRKSTRLNSSHH